NACYRIMRHGRVICLFGFFFFYREESESLVALPLSYLSPPGQWRTSPRLT
uniref:Uncharacterized protein n=1 Tax=Myripristis murdjan TaxID=586833 RepID=A0A667XR99_9TELE